MVAVVSVEWAEGEVEGVDAILVGIQWILPSKFN